MPVLTYTITVLDGGGFGKFGELTPVEATRVAEDRRFWRTSTRHLGCQRATTPSSSQTH